MTLLLYYGTSLFPSPFLFLSFCMVALFLLPPIKQKSPLSKFCLLSTTFCDHPKHSSFLLPPFTFDLKAELIEFLFSPPLLSVSLLSAPYSAIYCQNLCWNPSGLSFSEYLFGLQYHLCCLVPFSPHQQRAEASPHSLR